MAKTAARPKLRDTIGNQWQPEGLHSERRQNLGSAGEFSRPGRLILRQRVITTLQQTALSPLRVLHFPPAFQPSFFLKKRKPFHRCTADSTLHPNRMLFDLISRSPLAFHFQTKTIIFRNKLSRCIPIHQYGSLSLATKASFLWRTGTRARLEHSKRLARSRSGFGQHGTHEDRFGRL